MRYEGSSKAQGAFGVAAPLVEWRIETSILFAALDYLSAGDAVLVLWSRGQPAPRHHRDREGCTGERAFDGGESHRPIHLHPAAGFPRRWCWHVGFRYLEVKCLGCNTHQIVFLDIVRRPKTTPVHELERYMRCRQCSEVRRYAYKRSQLVALRRAKISADDPPSTWWPGNGE